MTAAVAEKARRYLLAGRVTVDEVSPGRVRAHCVGASGVYELVFAGGAWSCTCPARAQCAHLTAVQLVVDARIAATADAAAALENNEDDWRGEPR